MSFPTNPTEGQTYKNYIYENGAWKLDFNNLLDRVIEDESDNDLISDNDELWELNTTDLKSSKKREPSESEIVYFPAKISHQGVPTYNNQWRKWDGRGVVGLFKSTTNMLQDPEDFTTNLSCNG